jgi:hypothetical protein
MKNKCCGARNSKYTVLERSRLQVVGRAISWILPGVVLTAMPKCPLCLAAYVALFTGFGISLAVAQFAWWIIALGCIALLIYLASKSVFTLFRSH